MHGRDAETLGQNQRLKENKHGEVQIDNWNLLLLACKIFEPRLRKKKMSLY